MSIQSSVCAETNLGIATKAINDAIKKIELESDGTFVSTDFATDCLQEALHFCETHMTE